MSNLQNQVASLFQEMDAEYQKQKNMRTELLNLSDQDISKLGLDGLINRDQLEKYKRHDFEKEFPEMAARSILYESEPRKVSNLEDTMKYAETYDWGTDAEIDRRVDLVDALITRKKGGIKNEA